MNLNSDITMDYAKWTLGQVGKTNPKRTQNEPKTNPNEPKRTQIQKGQNERNLYYNKGI